MNCVVTWMYCSPQEEDIYYCQVGTANDEQTQLLYWRCVFLLFESSARLNKDTRHILFVNKMPPDFIDGVDISVLVKDYSIEIVQLSTITKTPRDYYGSWNTQFIMLDVLDWLTTNVTDDDNIFLLDCDIIFNKPIGPELIEKLNHHRALLYSYDHDDDFLINGLTPVELLNISREMSEGFPGDKYIYSCGEIVCCKGSEVREICRLARIGFRKSLDRYEKGLKKFNEEAHLLSYVYHLLGYETHTANAFIKRIWTERRIHSNIDGDEDKLVLWHLPAEKRLGFRKAFRRYRRQGEHYQLAISDFAKHYRIRQTIRSVLRDYAVSAYCLCRKLIAGKTVKS